MSSCNCPPLAKSMPLFGPLQRVNDRKHPWGWSGRKAVPNRALAIFLAVAIVIALVLPARADERPSDPFGNSTTELDKDARLVGIWKSLTDKMQLEKAYFHECLLLKEPPCPTISTLVQKLDDIRQYRGKALLGHLNLSVNLMIKPAPGEWTPPLETIAMRHGDCKAYSLAK